MITTGHDWSNHPILCGLRFLSAQVLVLLEELANLLHRSLKEDQGILTRYGIAVHR